MSRIPLLIAAILIAALPAYADDAQAIGDIRNEYLQTQKSLPSLSSFSEELPSKGSEKEKATVYYHGAANGALPRDIRKIAYQVSGPLALRQVDLFFRDGKLFFAYENLLKGDPGNWKEDRFYFKDGKLIHWLHGRDSIPESDPEYRANEKRVADLAMKLHSRFREYRGATSRP